MSGKYSFIYVLGLVSVISDIVYKQLHNAEKHDAVALVKAQNKNLSQEIYLTIIILFLF